MEIESVVFIGSGVVCRRLHWIIIDYCEILLTLTTFAIGAPLGDNDCGRFSCNEVIPTTSTTGDITGTIQLQIAPETFIPSLQVPVPGEKSFQGSALAARIANVNNANRLDVESQTFDDGDNEAGEPFGGFEETVFEQNSGFIVDFIQRRLIWGKY